MCNSCEVQRIAGYGGWKLVYTWLSAQRAVPLNLKGLFHLQCFYPLRQERIISQVEATAHLHKKENNEAWLNSDRNPGILFPVFNRFFIVVLFI